MCGGAVLGMKIRSFASVYIEFVMLTRHQNGNAKRTTGVKEIILGPMNLAINSSAIVF